VPAVLEQVTELGLNRREVVGMDTAPPEIRALQIVARLVTQPILDILLVA